jgi:hypothetical protein
MWIAEKPPNETSYISNFGPFSIKKYLAFLVRGQTIPTERPSLVGEVSANFFG